MVGSVFAILLIVSYDDSESNKASYIENASSTYSNANTSSSTYSNANTSSSTYNNANTSSSTYNNANTSSTYDSRGQKDVNEDLEKILEIFAGTDDSKSSNTYKPITLPKIKLDGYEIKGLEGIKGLDYWGSDEQKADIKRQEHERFMEQVREENKWARINKYNERRAEMYRSASEAVRNAPNYDHIINSNNTYYPSSSSYTSSVPDPIKNPEYYTSSLKGSNTNPIHIDVSGYTKSNGTNVSSYKRTAPNTKTIDNFSYKNNINPYTGEVGSNSN